MGKVAPSLLAGQDATPQQVPTRHPEARFSHVHLDRATWAEAMPLLNVQAAAIVKVFVSRWVTIFGVPSTVTTDQDSLPNSPQCSWLTMAYHPAAKGMDQGLQRQCAAEDPGQIACCEMCINRWLRSSTSVPHETRKKYQI
ncbi:unnamed protein product [Schistocephalus solidus]|uniref:Transposase n=1 Tax=Schistocephalus solidus TaxID=70667 RepID=A0A183T1Q4_SCHSO|nr:unnamed protein product [Schistocephalus solidus]